MKIEKPKGVRAPLVGVFYGVTSGSRDELHLYAHHLSVKLVRVSGEIADGGVEDGS